MPSDAGGDGQSRATGLAVPSGEGDLQMCRLLWTRRSVVALCTWRAGQAAGVASGNTWLQGLVQFRWAACVRCCCHVQPDTISSLMQLEVLLPK